MTRIAVALVLACAVGLWECRGLRADEMITLKPCKNKGEECFTEVFRREAVISSGGRVVGIVADADPSDHFPELRVAVPDDWKGDDICISLTSADGLYESRNTFTVPAALVSQIAPVDYTMTRHTADLARVSREQMAVLASRGGCDSRRQLYAVAFWSTAPPRMPANVRILVNSFRADRVELYTAAGKAFRCERISGLGQTTFDARCEVELKALHPGRNELEIVTLHGSTVDPLPTVHLQLESKK
jgi:hypothetical protein